VYKLLLDLEERNYRVLVILRWNWNKLIVHWTVSNYCILIDQRELFLTTEKALNEIFLL